LQQTAPLLDHLVGSGLQREWYRKSERLSGLEVDDQLETLSIWEISESDIL
jgi:hypothetical protein